MLEEFRERLWGSSRVHRITHIEMSMISKSQEPGWESSIAQAQALVHLIPGLTFSCCLFLPRET